MKIKLNARRDGQTYVIEARCPFDGYKNPINLGVLKQVAPGLWDGEMVWCSTPLRIIPGVLNTVLTSIRREVDAVEAAMREDDEEHIPDEDGEIARERWMDIWASEQTEIDRLHGC